MKLKKRFETKKVKLKDIKLDPTNPNRLSDIKKAGLRKSLKTFGYVQDIIIDKKTMMIADGEHRLKELMESGVEEVEVKVFNFKNEVERRLFRQTANKLRGSHDLDLDKEEFRFLDENDSLSDLAEMLGEDEMDFIYEEENLPDDAKNELDVKLKRSVSCPSCGATFDIDRKEK